MTGGRPLRFLALTLGGWVLVRIAVLLSEIEPRQPLPIRPTLTKILVPPAAATVFPAAATVFPAAAVFPGPRQIAFVIPPLSDTVVTPAPPAIVFRAKPRTDVALPPRVSGLPETWSLDHIAAQSFGQQPPGRTDAPPFLLAPFVVRGASRLNGSAWLLVRGGPAGTVSGGQLGASQAGLRITYAIDAARRFALSARVAAPLEGRGREAAVGIEWQPTRMPIRLIVEHRFVLDGGRNGPTIGVLGGYGPADIVPGVRLETYGQAGAIARDGLQTFVDASARLTHPLGTVATARLDIGIGTWASAQRAAERFDIGPSVVATLPIAHKSLRLTLDWRERIAGGARPGSGPALSIGSDF
jgi:hypothetical protein